MESDNRSSDAEQTARRIRFLLDQVGRLLAVFQDGIANWDEVLPPFQSKPRRWPRDDHAAHTVGEVLLSRYGGYDWCVLETLMDADGSLGRAYSRGRMTANQQRRFLRYRDLLDSLRQPAIELGVVFDWRIHAIAPRLIELRPDHPSVRFLIDSGRQEDSS